VRSPRSHLISAAAKLIHPRSCYTKDGISACKRSRKSLPLCVERSAMLRKCLHTNFLGFLHEAFISGVDKITIADCGTCFLISRAASNPFRTGIVMLRTTTSGLTLLTSSTA
jgi:hypothetical protein